MNSERRSNRGPRGGRRRGGGRRPPERRRPPVKGPVYDLYVAYPCETQDDVRRIIGEHKQPYRELEWPYTRVTLLAQALVEEVKEFARSGHPRYGGGYKWVVHRRKGDNPYNQGVIRPGLRQLEHLKIYPPQIDLKSLPPHSAFIQFRFTLARPFRSNDDDSFYIHENPVLKDVVFKIPMMRPSGWKGILRSVMAGQFEEGENAPIIARLFGLARGEAEEGLSNLGRLRFYPTFFDRIDLDIINPHSRSTKAGTVPIPLETVPAGAGGVFTLLYLPFDLVGQDPEQARIQATEDLQAIGQGILMMMRVYGFSAKRSRGYGLAHLQVKGVDGEKGTVVMKGRGMQTFGTLTELPDALELLLGTTS